MTLFLICTGIAFVVISFGLIIFYLGRRNQDDQPEAPQENDRSPLAIWTFVLIGIIAVGLIGVHEFQIFRKLDSLVSGQATINQNVVGGFNTVDQRFSKVDQNVAEEGQQTRSAVLAEEAITRTEIGNLDGKVTKIHRSQQQLSRDVRVVKGLVTQVDGTTSQLASGQNDIKAQVDAGLNGVNTSVSQLAQSQIATAQAIVAVDDKVSGLNASHTATDMSSIDRIKASIENLKTQNQKILATTDKIKDGQDQKKILDAINETNQLVSQTSMLKRQDVYEESRKASEEAMSEALEKFKRWIKEQK